MPIGQTPPFPYWLESDREVMNERLDRAHGVTKDGSRIVSIATESGRMFAGRMFIDATYEGTADIKFG